MRLRIPTMRKFVLLILTVLFLSCSGEASKSEEGTALATGVTEQVKVPEDLRRFLYPGSAVEKVLVGEGSIGVVMRTKDDIRKVAEFYLKKFGKPEDKVVNSWAVSYLYRRENAMIHIEREDGGSVISVSLVK